MKEHIETLITSLSEEMGRLRLERGIIMNELEHLVQKRRTATREELELCVPSLKMSVVVTLFSKVPGFPIPLVPIWFGLANKVHPSMTVELLRIKLGNHLDNLDEEQRKSLHDSIMRSYYRYDESITQSQQSIAEYSAMIQLQEERLAALEKLWMTDLHRLSPELRVQLESAVMAQDEQGIKTPRSTGKPNTSSRTDETPRSDSHLDSWLWYQLLTPDSDVGAYIAQADSQDLGIKSPPETAFVPGGGTFGGGGADGSWPDNSTPTASAPATDVATHQDLGSGSFS